MGQLSAAGERGAKSLHRQVAAAVAPAQLIQLSVRVENLAHIRAAYGEGAADAAHVECVRLTRNFLGGQGIVSPNEVGRFGTLAWAVGSNSNCANMKPAEQAHALVLALATNPVRFADQIFHVVPTVACVPIALNDADDGAVSQTSNVHSDRSFDGESAGYGEDWGFRYRRDMREACTLLRALSNDRIEIAWQPVQSSADPDQTLYFEGQLRLIGPACEISSVGSLLAAAERLGLIRALDGHAVSQAISELEKNPDVNLGINISSQSARFDEWWLDAAERLEGRPDIASRLIIEITEGARPTAPSHVSRFADEVRKLGCRIALNGFGTGHASIRHLLALRPDIVKVDGFFLARASNSERDETAFRHLVGLVKSLAPIVVVEGVDTAALSRLASDAGADCAQGASCGPWTIIRPWRVDGRLGGCAASTMSSARN